MSHPEDPAYTIFTSGSTGQPKGVIVAHRPVVNLIEWVNRTFAIAPTDRVLFVTSLSFDLSVYDIFGILAAGGSIRVASSDEIRDPRALMQSVRDEPITFWNSAPPTLQQLVPLLPVEDEGPVVASLRLVFLSGDWIPVTLPDHLRRAFPGVEVVSLGGATEAAVWSNVYRIGPVDPTWTSIPYGKPIQNAEYFILDQDLRPCPIGVTGELFIGGECLAIGYTNVEKTRQRFLTHTLAGTTKRIYRTGDLARYWPDGNIELLGRIDNQVKIRGYRVELGEIEFALRQHLAVKEAIVVARDDASGSKCLVAYVVAKPHHSINPSEIRAALQQQLPSYMVPSSVVALDHLPLNSSGKIDRRALPAPEIQRDRGTDAYEAPRTERERVLVALWERLLGVPRIGIRDDFFDLGGHSLLAARMVVDIERLLQRTIALAAVFRAPTIEQLASVLDDAKGLPQIPSLAIIQAGHDRTPLFCLHVLGRGMKFLRPLARHLDPAQPIYGLSTHLLHPEDAPENRVETLADYYIAQIRAIQPHGPYLLAGLSFGGAVAYEVAMRLREAGESIQLLALFDAANVSAIKRPSQPQRIAHCLRLLAGGNWRVVQEKASMFVAKHLTLWQRRWCRLNCRWHQWRGHELSEDLLDFQYKEANAYAATEYIPRACSTPIVFFKGKDARNFEMHPEDTWKSVAQAGIDVYDIPGDHLGMMQEPGVAVLGAALQSCLDRANATDPLKRGASCVSTSPPTMANAITDHELSTIK